MKFIDGITFVDMADSIFTMENGPETYFPYPNTFTSSSEGIVYTHTHTAKNLFPILKNIERKYVLVTHNVDMLVDENLYSQLPPNVIKWYSASITFQGEKLESLPWGVESLQRFEFHHIDKRLKMTQKVLEPKNHRNLLYVKHSVWTNRKERFKPYVLLKDKPFATVEQAAIFDFDHYIDSAYNHKFVLSPPGHAIDSHRTWETLYLNSIPIEKRNINNSFWRDLPICFVDDWEEITEDFLNKEYERITQMKWDMSKLTPEYWTNKIISEKNNL